MCNFKSQSNIMKKLLFLLLISLSLGTVTPINAQFTDLKAAPAKNQVHKLTIWFYHGWLYFFF